MTTSARARDTRLRTGATRWLTRAATAGLIALAAAVPSFAAPISASAETVTTNATVRATQTWFLYVAEGEYPFVQFSKAGSDTGSSWADGTRILITDPSGAEVSSCTILTTDANGTACTWTGGVVPTPAAQDGVYGITLTRPVGRTSTAQFGPVTLRWTIDARTSPTGGEISGRVWSERYGIRDTLGSSIDLDLWYQTEFGFTYAVQRRGMMGLDSRFDANAFGNVNTATCTPARRSLTQTDALDALSIDNAIFASLRESTCAYTPYKIFFAPPSADLPATVTLPGAGEPTWLRTEPPGASDVRVENLRFETAAPGSRAGTLRFDVSKHEGDVVVQVDVDNDGDFEGAADRQFRVAVVGGGPVELTFDGVDAFGEPISPQTPLATRVLVENTGEVHFVDEDVERLWGGVRVERLNGPLDGRTEISWNDERLAGVTEAQNPAQTVGPRCSTTSVVAGDRVDSASGVHGWGTGSCTSAMNNVTPTQIRSLNTLGTWGNLAVIDRWASVPVNKQYTLEVPAFEIAKSSDPVSGSQVIAGSTVNYRVTASPIRYSHLEEGNLSDDIWYPATSWGGRFTDDLGDVIDDAVVDWDSFSVSPANGGSVVTTPDAAMATWTGIGVPIADTVAVSYSVKVHLEGQGSGDRMLRNVAYTHESETPPGVPSDCVPRACATTEHPVVPADDPETLEVPENPEAPEVEPPTGSASVPPASGALATTGADAPIAAAAVGALLVGFGVLLRIRSRAQRQGTA